MELNIDFFHIVNDSVAEKGNILISEPFLADNYFRRSIVYLTEHNSEGSMGFVLNKPLGIRINEIVEDFPECDLSVSVGGPVSNNTVHYIHTLGAQIPDSIEVAEGIFWGGEFDLVKQLVAEGSVKSNELRFFLGYAGWSEGQLHAEMEEHAWLVGKLPRRMVMHSMGSEFWEKTLASYNNKYRAWANFPEDPGLN
ncbi:MAG: YqgE/AlgH family protein [Bacteroidia bacterium]|nr:MAG: YqgE/AlgH family protein [Bacteroidia bacterium]